MEHVLEESIPGIKMKKKTIISIYYPQNLYFSKIFSVSPNIN